MLYIASWIDCALSGRYVTWLPSARLQCWMLLSVYTLPQLAVSAKILCLLMVVVCGAVPSRVVRSVLLWSECAHTHVNVFPDGTVMARPDGNNQPNLTMSTSGINLELLIHSPIQDMYLCFNRSRLVGRRLTYYQALRQPNCLFKEEFVNGWNRYHLVKNKDRYIGFNRRGLPLRRGMSRLSEDQRRCLWLMPESRADFDLDRHNQERARNMQTSRRPQPRPQRRYRHHHGRSQRRRNSDGT